MSERAPWTPLERIAFRFVFVYLSLWMCQHELQGFVPYQIPWLGPKSGELLNWVVKWYQNFPPRLIPGIYPVACSDRLSNTSAFYCWALDATFLIVVAGVAAFLWTLLDRKRLEYRRLYRVLCIMIRFGVAVTMFMFGIPKLFGGQGMGIGPEGIDLASPLGDWAQASVVWKTTGFSFVYLIFTGLGELSACVLLVFRRTVSLGAMIMLALGATIGTLDFAHSHPYSGRAWFYILMAAVLLAPDIKRLAALYVFNRPVPAPEPAPRLLPKPFEGIVKIAFVGNFLWGTAGFINQHLPSNRWYMKPPHAITGLYEVQQFERNNVAIPALLTDSVRWRYLDIMSKGGDPYSRWDLKYPGGSAVAMDGTPQEFDFKVDTVKHRITFTSRNGTRLWGGRRPRADTLKGDFAYAMPDRSTFELAGTLGKDSLVVRMHRVDDTLSPFRRAERFHREMVRN